MSSDGNYSDEDIAYDEDIEYDNSESYESYTSSNEDETTEALLAKKWPRDNFMDTDYFHISESDLDPTDSEMDAEPDGDSLDLQISEDSSEEEAGGEAVEEADEEADEEAVEEAVEGTLSEQPEDQEPLKKSARDKGAATGELW
jgi:hypothetical protein